MAETNFGQEPNFIRLTGGIVAAYVSNNSVPLSELPPLITKVHSAVAGLASGTTSIGAFTVELEKPTQAQIRKSIRDDGIISFINGRTYKTLKRHLSAHGLHAQSYRERYGLPADYPMVAPRYAEKRSVLAKAVGLGQPSITVAG